MKKPATKETVGQLVTFNLNAASFDLRTAARAYVASDDSQRGKAWQGLCVAAKAFAEAQTRFSTWVNNLPRQGPPPHDTQEGL